MLKTTLLSLLIATLLGCSAMPREKLKESFSDIDIGDDISSVLSNLKNDKNNCSEIDSSTLKRKYPSEAKNAIYYRCSVETDTLFCLHTGTVIFAAENGTLVFIEQGVYRSKVCLWH